MEKISGILYLTSYVFLFAIAIGVLFIFKPYKYLDNSTSHIICDKNGRVFEAGWNFIYSFDGKLDSFNDTKARKICEYNSIKDYANVLQTPPQINYRFEPKFIQDSDWADAIFMFFAAFIFGAFIIEIVKIALIFLILKKKTLINSPSLKNLLLFFILSAIIVPLLFLAIVKKPAAVIYCKRQVARKVNNFKNIIFKYGIFPIPQEDKNIQSLLPSIYKNCLKNEGVQ